MCVLSKVGIRRVQPEASQLEYRFRAGFGPSHPGLLEPGLHEAFAGGLCYTATDVHLMCSILVVAHPFSVALKVAQIVLLGLDVLLLRRFPRPYRSHYGLPPAFQEVLATIRKPLVRLRGLCVIPRLSYLRKMLRGMVEVQYLSRLGEVVLRLLPYPATWSRRELPHLYSAQPLV